MDFRTAIKPLTCQGLLRHDMEVWTIGSCFSDAMGWRMGRDLFQVRTNPLGTLFNPLSIRRALDNVLANRLVAEAELVECQGLWHSMDYHSKFSRATKAEIVSTINSQIEKLHALLPKLRLLIVTFGSAFAHRYLPTGEVAGNCHKLPAKHFAVEEISIDQIIQAWIPLMAELKKGVPELKFIFTVSPVRHLSYGAAADKLSKARLLLAVDLLVKAFPDDAAYFPAYEIMDDDLRDYRFYASDMVHPSDTAADYIYDIFKQSFCDSDTIAIAKESRKLTAFLSHNPLLSPHSSEIAHREFMDSWDRTRSSLFSKYPYLETAYDLLSC